MKSLVPWKRGSEVPVRRSDELAGISSRIDRLFDDFFRGFGLAPWSPWTLDVPEASESTWPVVDVVETGDAIRVTAELPGVDEKDVELSLSGDSLVMRGEKRAERTDEGDGWRRTERYHGHFHRSIPLPCEVESKDVEARFSRGVLTVELPKSQAARKRTKRIAVKATD